MGGSFTSKFNQPESETQKSAKRKPRPTTTDRPRPVDPTIQKQTPGPGEYYNPKLASSLNVSKKPPPNLQFFGSTSQRFSEPLSQKSEIPGPGAYNPDKPHKKLPEKLENLDCGHLICKECIKEYIEEKVPKINLKFIFLGFTLGI